VVSLSSQDFLKEEKIKSDENKSWLKLARRSMVQSLDISGFRKNFRNLESILWEHFLGFCLSESQQEIDNTLNFIID
jgi:hypothetical protein